MIEEGGGTSRENIIVLRYSIELSRKTKMVIEDTFPFCNSYLKPKEQEIIVPELMTSQQLLIRQYICSTCFDEETKRIVELHDDDAQIRFRVLIELNLFAKLKPEAFFKIVVDAAKILNIEYTVANPCIFIPTDDE